METLNYAQRAILQAAQTRRMKAAKLARLQQAIAAAQAPDYFAWAASHPCRDCKGTTRGGPNTTDGGPDDDCLTCSATGWVQP